MFDILFINNRYNLLNSLIMDGLYKEIDTNTINLLTKLYHEFDKRIIIKCASVFGSEFSENSGKHTDDKNLVCEIYIDDTKDYSDLFRRMMSHYTTSYTIDDDDSKLEIILGNDGFDDLFPKKEMIAGLAQKYGCAEEVVLDIYNQYIVSIWINNPSKKILSYMKKEYNGNEDKWNVINYEK